MPVTIAVDAIGNTHVTGGFRGMAQFGNTTLTSAPNANNLSSIDLYVAKFGPQSNFQWAVQIVGVAANKSFDLVHSSSGALCLLG